MAGTGPAIQTKSTVAERLSFSAFPAQPNDHVNAGDLVAFRRGWRLTDNHLGIWDVEYLIFAFDKEMMVRRRIGIEIGFRSIDRDLTEKADFRELVQRVVNCRERDWHFRARRFFVKHLGGEMAIAFTEENPAQRHALAGWTQSNLTQHGLYIMPWAAGEDRSIRRMAGIGYYLRDHGSTRWRHYPSYPSGRSDTRTS